MPRSGTKEKKSNKNARSSHAGAANKSGKAGSGYKGKIEQDGPKALDKNDPNASEDEVEEVEEVEVAQVGRSCAACGNDTGVLLCARCKSVGYCSKACQKLDWTKGHKAACVPGANKLAGTCFVHFPPQDEVMFPGDERFKAFDNDCCLGETAPDTTSLSYISDAKYGKAVKGKINVFLFWAQFHKPGYKFLPLYSALASKFKTINFVAVSVDPTADYAQKFLDDPNLKYSKGAFTTTIAVAHDDKSVVKKAFAAALGDVLALPHAFVVDAAGKIVWHQDHSELGATVPNYMHLMEKQLDLLLAGEPLHKCGDRVFDHGDDDDEEEEEDGMDTGDMGDMFGF